MTLEEATKEAATILTRAIMAMNMEKGDPAYITKFTLSIAGPQLLVETQISREHYKISRELRELS